MGYSGARVTLIFEKNLKSKISCQTPFKAALFILCLNAPFKTILYDIQLI